MLSGTVLHLWLPPGPQAIKRVAWWQPSVTASSGTGSLVPWAGPWELGIVWCCNQRWSKALFVPSVKSSAKTLTF